MYRSNQDTFVNPKDAEIRYFIPHPNQSLNHRYSFKYVEAPAFGCGPAGNKIISCDSCFDVSLIDGVAEEFNANLAAARGRLHHMTPFGLVPTELNGAKCLDSYLINLEKYDPTHDYITYSKNLMHYHDFKHYMAGRFNLNRPWKGVVHFKKLKSFFEKNDIAEWNEVAHLFPKLVRLVDSMPFKTVGYVMIMRSNENSHLDIHRDIYPRNHSCHHINVHIDLKPKPFFIYDPITKTKTYKDDQTLSYFFNECDLHGTDYIFEERLTMRVDGVFEDWFAKQIGLENGVTFDCYRANGGIRITQETDI